MVHEGDLRLHTEQKVSHLSTYLKNIVWGRHTIPHCHAHPERLA